jgi:hypothetical protein
MELMKNNPSSFPNAADTFISKFSARVRGVLHGFDRLRLRGTLPQLYCPTVMAAYLNARGVLLKDFGKLVESTSAAVHAATEAFAQRWQRPVEYVSSSQRSKEQLAREIAARDGVEEGLIAVLKAVEPCRSFSVRGNPQTKLRELRLEQRKCLHYYFYFEHARFGFMHLRLQSWFPFQIEVCLNGRHWLARQLSSAGLGYQKRENAFTWVEDMGRAQAFLEE